MGVWGLEGTNWSPVCLETISVVGFTEGCGAGAAFSTGFALLAALTELALTGAAFWETGIK